LFSQPPGSSALARAHLTMFYVCIHWALPASLDKHSDQKKIVISLSATVGLVTLTARGAAIASLQQLLDDRLSTAASIREGHGKDASYHPCVPPDAVAFALSTGEVSEIVKICAQLYGR
jgi:hypothetical protein